MCSKPPCSQCITGTKKVSFGKHGQMLGISVGKSWCSDTSKIPLYETQLHVQFCASAGTLLVQYAVYSCKLNCVQVLTKDENLLFTKLKGLS